jgi:hypothetical protein
MPREIKTKKTFGTCSSSRILPQPNVAAPKAMNIHITFE